MCKCVFNFLGGTASPIAVSPTPSHQPAPGSSFNRTALLLGVLGSCVLLALATAVCIAFMFVLRSLYKHRHSTNNSEYNMYIGYGSSFSN